MNSPLAAIRIVSARLEDTEAIATMGKDIWHRCYFPDVLSIDAVAYLWQRTLSPSAVREEMARGVRYEWIEQVSTRIGFLAWHHLAEQQRMRLNKLYLLPEYHGLGIGALALTYIKEVAAQLGVKEIYLYVFKKNRKAIRAYLKAGFIIAREEVTDAGQGYCYDDYVMSYSL
ncbi:MAG: GNAT family N-acetyltransferase [Methylohalobius sp.]|nr:GNAT family N-acetyltransferase [Methylohalobius sp.]